MPWGKKRTKARQTARHGGQSAFGLAARVMVLAVIIALALIAAMADSYLLGFMAALLLGLIVRSLIPTGKFKDTVRSFWSGEAGESVFNRLWNR